MFDINYVLIMIYLIGIAVCFTTRGLYCSSFPRDTGAKFCVSIMWPLITTSGILMRLVSLLNKITMFFSTTLYNSIHLIIELWKK
jgi:hypothetical protein